MIFSHGLGGSRNAYSHLAGSIASHGMIVIALEHRDGSAPISYIRDVPSNNSVTEKSSAKRSKRTVDYMRLSHTPSPEVEAGRDAQLKVRLWELGVITETLRQLDFGEDLGNLNTSSMSLSPFKDMMDIHTPGKVIFAGHSFGAATVSQFVKSVFYSPRTSEAPSTYKPLFTPSSRSPIREQITSQTPLILLDMWCFPLRSSATRWLWNLPLPCYSTSEAPGGSAILAVESQAFFKWATHLKATKRFLSPNPKLSKYNYEDQSWTQPHLFYAKSSAHLSQSDFGVLFPWVTKKVFGSEEPERVMRLNVRAILQVLRNQGIEISSTSAADMELLDISGEGAETTDDTLILGRKEQVRGWIYIKSDDGEQSGQESESDDEDPEATKPSDPVVGNKIKHKSGNSEPPTTSAAKL
jgi:platelet-activating factor acetylhydrolase